MSQSIDYLAAWIAKRCDKYEDCTLCPLNANEHNICYVQRPDMSEEEFHKILIENTRKLLAVETNTAVDESIQTNDPVNHPSHYETGKFECIEVMQEALGTESVIQFCICNAFKYLYRFRRKNGMEDIQKAGWYINKALELFKEM